jgi:hypothetical protein
MVTLMVRCFFANLDVISFHGHVAASVPIMPYKPSGYVPSFGSSKATGSKYCILSIILLNNLN